MPSQVKPEYSGMEPAVSCLWSVVVVWKLPLDLKVRASDAAACVVNGHVCSLVGEACLGCCITIF